MPQSVYFGESDLWCFLFNLQHRGRVLACIRSGKAEAGVHVVLPRNMTTLYTKCLKGNEYLDFGLTLKTVSNKIMTQHNTIYGFYGNQCLRSSVSHHSAISYNNFSMDVKSVYNVEIKYINFIVFCRW